MLKTNFKKNIHRHTYSRFQSVGLTAPILNLNIQQIYRVICKISEQKYETKLMIIII